MQDLKVKSLKRQRLSNKVASLKKKFVLLIIFMSTLFKKPQSFSLKFTIRAV